MPAPVRTAMRRPRGRRRRSAIASVVRGIELGHGRHAITPSGPPGQSVGGAVFRDVTDARAWKSGRPCASSGSRSRRTIRARSARDYRDLTDVALRRVLEPDGGLYIAESAKVIGRALAAGHRPRSVLVQEKWLRGCRGARSERTPTTPVYVVDARGRRVAHRVRGAPRRARRDAPPRRSLRWPTSSPMRGLVVVLEDIVDHTNVGAIFRACRGARRRRRADLARAAPIRCTAAACG